MNNHIPPLFQFSNAKITPIATIYKLDAANNIYRQIETSHPTLPQVIRIAKKRSNALKCDVVLERYSLGKWDLFTGLQKIDAGPAKVGNWILHYDEKGEKVTEALMVLPTTDKQIMFVYTFGGDFNNATDRMKLARAYLHYLEKYGSV